MKQHLVPLVDDALTALKARGALALAAPPAYVVGPPKDAAHGDLQCNVAMVLAKPEGKQPRAIAELVAAELRARTSVVARVEVAGPGFINVTLVDAVVQSVAREVLTAGDAWGIRPKRSSGKRVMVEFCSANPTGPVHVGHARGTFTGDAIARVLEAAGHDVTREFYINDHGNQVDNLGRAVQARYLELHGAGGAFVAEYPGEYVKEIARAFSDVHGAKLVGAPSDAWLAEARAFAIAHNLAAIKRSLAKANVRHDVFTSEASLHESGRVIAVVDHYRQRGVTYEADVARGTEGKKRREESKAAQYEERQQGGTFLMTSLQGDEEDRVILRKDGTPVYLTADLAYHKDKFDRGFDRAVDVFGADHGGHVPRIKAGVKLLGDERNMDFVLVQMVKITRDGQEVKLSKRKGTVYELDDLLEDAGADPCRIMFLDRTVTSQLDFDLALVEKQSKDSPVWYFKYGHARCAQILKRAAEGGQAFAGPAHLEALTLPEERAMLMRMGAFADVVVGAAEALEPHRVLTYCRELIAGFHGYYSKYKDSERVISDDKDKTQARLSLVAALKQTLKNAFMVIGVDAPDYMAAPEQED